MEQDYNIKHWTEPCRKVDCRKNSCKCGIEKVFIPAAMGDDSEGSPIAPANGAYCNALVVYEANGHKYIYSKEGIPTLITSGGGGDYDEIIKEIQDDLAETEDDLAKEVLDRVAGDNTLQGEIDAIKNSPDVVDIVPTYAALQAYDTSSLGDNDIIRVLQDEQHDGQSTYYRWNKQSSTWTYIGTVGDYYTKGQVDTLLTGKQDTLTAGANVQISPENVISATDTTYTHFTGATTSTDGTAGLVPAPVAGDDTKFLSGDGTWGTPAGTTYTAGTNVQISAQNVISATDTTYSNFVGTDGQTAGTAGLVPAPATTDAGKFLKADGTWAAAGGGGGDTVYSTKNTSNSETGGAVYIGNLNASQEEQPDPTTVDTHRKYFWALPHTNVALPQGGSVNILGQEAGEVSVAIGSNAICRLGSQVAIGGSTLNSYSATFGSAIGYGAQCLSANAVALGHNAKTSRDGEVNVGAGTSGAGYNNTNYRVIGGVHDPVDAHDAATKGYVDANAGGPTVVQDKGTSTTDVMSQNAVSKAIYDYVDSSGRGYRPKIGDGASTGGLKSMAIGDDTMASGQNSVALGGNARAIQNGSIALGYGASTSSVGEMNIGSSSTSYGYNSSNYRLLSGLYDGQEAHDAVTVNQVNSVIDAINTALSTNIPHIGA